VTLHDDVLARIAAFSTRLADLDDALVASILPILEELERELVEQIRLADLTPGRRRTHRLARAERLLEQTRGTIAGRYDEIGRRLDERLQGTARFSLEFTHGTLRTAVGPILNLVNVNTVVTSPELLEALAGQTLVSMGDVAGAAPVRDWLAEQQRNLVEAFAKQMRQGLLRGEGIPELTRRIAGGGAHQGIGPVSREWAEALARTANTAVGAAARDELYAANGSVVRGIYQVTTRDEHTTIVCLAYAGKGFVRGEDGLYEPLGHTLPYNGGVPRHVNCRSIEAPLVRSLAELGIEPSEVPGEFREYFGVAPPAEQAGEAILEGRSETFQDRVLGPTRAKLWRDGKLRLEDLVTPEGRVVPIANLSTASAG